MRTILVTGAAGFIGMHVCQALLARGDRVIGLDNLNAYYDPQLKRDRLAHITQGLSAAALEAQAFRFVHADVADLSALQALMHAAQEEGRAPTEVVHLAAQAGVRHSISHPHDYAQANLVGFVNVLEICRHHAISHLVYASSSSVYGGNVRMPFHEDDGVDHPVSLYAATKKANELMAHTYSHLYGLATTGLRFFTVYGPWGRPDMAPMLFARAILAGEPIDVFNHGQMRRDFTYIDDIVRGVLATLDRTPEAQPDYDRQQAAASSSWAPYRIFNIGHSQPVPLMDFIATLERALGCKASLRMKDMAAGDVAATYADTSALQAWTGVAPQVSLEAGLQQFVAWYRSYHI